MLNAQIREAQVRFPIQGENLVQHFFDNDSKIVKLFPDNILHSKGNKSGYIDTTYVVRFSTVFQDVHDWDSAYYVSGYTHNFRTSSFDSVNISLLTRVKIAYDGNVIWKKTDSVMLGDHFTRYNTSMVKLSDGNFMQMGSVRNDYRNWKNYDWRAAVFTKFNANGDTIWQMIYKDTAYMKSGFWPQDIVAESNGGFTIATLEASDSKTYSLDSLIDYWYTDTTYVGIISFDSLGNIIHRKRYFIGGHPVIPSIGLLMKQPDNGYLVGGVNYFSGDLKSYYLFKTDSLFNWEWKKIFGQTASSVPYIEIVPKLNNQYYFSVARSDTPVVYDSQGNKYYDGYYQVGVFDSMFNIIQGNMLKIELINPPSPFYFDAGFVVGSSYNNKSGLTVCSHIGSNGADLVKFDSNLSVQWNRWIADFPYFTEEPYKMRRAHDGGYLIVGKSIRSGVGGWFVKTDTNGFALPNGADTLYHIGIGKQPEQNIGFRVYPNPTSDKVNIVFEEIPKGKIETQLYDITGRLIETKEVNNVRNVTIELYNLNDGIYILNIKSDKGWSKSVKVIKN